MPPLLATLLTVGFIFFLLLRDSRNQDEVNGALWLPVFWMVISGSRFVSQWINLGTYGGSANELHGGNPIDALYFLSLIILGIRVLVNRRVVVGVFFQNNRWMTVYLLYCFLAIVWSDFPFIAFKRYVKTLGHPIMALIILTDPDPVNALRTVMKRCAYFMMPLSVLFIKYYPQYGRGFDPWTGMGYNNGIMLNKNELGYGCMLLGVFFFWNFLITRNINDRRARLEESFLSLGFLFMIGWLLHMAQSATSLVTLVIGLFTISLLGLRVVNKRRIGTYLIATILVVVGLDLSFDIYVEVIKLLGRDPTLTDRTVIWADCLALVDNPIFGLGFESFWLGSRLEILWEKWLWRPNQAHNGYIEIYLNLGIVGIVLFICMIFSTFHKISINLSKHFDFARLRLGFLFAIIFYNYTEATFKGVHLVWTVFYIIAIDYPVRDKLKQIKTSNSKKNSWKRVTHRYKLE